MMLRVIIWLSIIWLAPLVCFLLRNEAKRKKNIVVGVTLPYDAREDEEVLTKLKNFRKAEVWICVLLVLAAIPCMFVGTFSVTLFLWGVWLLLCIALPYIPYILCNKALHKIKYQRGWLRFLPGKIIVDTSTIPDAHWLSPFFFLIPLFISLLPLLWERVFWFLYIIDTACILLFWLCYRYLYRNKSEKVDDNAALTKTLTRVRRHNWGIMWIISSYAMAAMNLGIGLTLARPLPMLFVTLGVSLVIVFAVVRVELKTRSVQEKLTAQSGHDLYIDDDDKWIWGFLYYNPQDSHTFINDRIGVNLTVNLARPFGKAMAVLTIVTILAVPFLSPIIESTANKPPVMAYSSTQLTAKSGGKEYQISLSEIEEAELLEKLPGDLSRVVGTGLDTLLKGRFTSKETGSVEVCLDPTCPPFILITTDQDRHYLFGTRDSVKTRAIYEKLLAITTDKEN